MERLDLRGCSLEELKEICRQASVPTFRAKQLFDWVQDKVVSSWDEMKNIPAHDRQKLMEGLILHPLEILRETQSQDGTLKFLFRLMDQETIECVLMDYERLRHRDRHTVCVSTQVGCAVGCAFCATGLGGFKRNLTAGEIVGQILDISRHVRQKDGHFQVTNIVFMGMGEPLLNYDEVLKAIQLLNSDQGQNIGMRRMTISTCGIVPKIIQLAKDNPQVGLAVSLHAPNDRERDQLIPINRRYPLDQLMKACQVYAEQTHRRVTFEVALIAERTTPAFAEELASLLRGQLAHVNLIPVNPVPGTEMTRPTPEQINKVARILEQAGISVSVREERGTDIDAACGQLRRHWESD